MTSWIEVSEQRLTENFRVAQEILARETASSTALLAVIKANAYGHGAGLCAPVLARAGAEWLGVTDAAEGATVRTAMEVAGIAKAQQPRILVMSGHLPVDVPVIVQHSLTPVVWRQQQMAALAEAAGAEPCAVHLEIDSGMSRQGVALGGLRELLRWLANEPRIRLDGVMTHFASAEVAGSEQTLAQRKQFEAAVQLVAEAGLRPTWIHAGNTSMIDNGADGDILAWLHGLAASVGARAMVREGLGLYGYALPLEGLAVVAERAARLRAVVRPVMTWKTRVIGISEVEAGARVGYNGTFTAEKTMRLALLPVGYADGLRRELGCSTWNRGGWVMFHVERAPIVGRVSMNLTTVDVTEIEGVAVGDEVVLLGEGSTAEDHAALAGTISYEILCGMRAPVVLV
ncbi:alanine racemase [Granulicella arctica]|uniref:Alanine racemase n=1 Tax=Granulicella arctica TaxID=940613 RepID=A0A7Y9TGH2_9BACT|nr:alanine racemase [Granulicella arctica]